MRNPENPLSEILENFFSNTSVSFPPANIKRFQDGSFGIELALAGYDPSTIDVIHDGKKVVVQTNENFKSDNGVITDYEYTMHQIAGRKFRREFTSQYDDITIDAKFLHGLLVLRITPPKEKPIQPVKINIA